MRFKLNDSLLNKEVFFIYYKGLRDNYDFVNETIVSYFNALDLIQINDSSFAIVVQAIPSPLEDTIEEILELLKFDLDINLNFLIGNKHTYDKETPSYFESEVDYLAIAFDRINYITELYIQKTLKTAIKPEKLYPQAFNLIENNPETKEMIQKLWVTSTNIAQCASKLYLHRNTLIYRMDKFEKETQLDLKNQNDLLISYLLTLRSS